MINKVILVGRLGADPEVNTSETSVTLAKFGLATNSGKDQTEWHNIVVFDKLANNVKDYLKKGSLIYLEGAIKYRVWQDKEGKDKHTTEIIANKIQFLDSRKDNIVFDIVDFT